MLIMRILIMMTLMIMMSPVGLFQNNKVSPGLLVPGSNMEAHVAADDGMKPASNTQLIDDSGCQNELTITNEMLASRLAINDADRNDVMSPRPPEQTVVNAGKVSEQLIIEPGTSGMSSQENTVTRTRSRDVMDFANLKMKLVQLTGPSKEAGGPATAAKTKAETEEMKDVLLDSVGAVSSAASNSDLQGSAGRPGQQVDMQPAAQRGPSVSPDLSTAPAHTSSLPELQATTVVQRDVSVQPAVVSVAVGQTKVVPSNGEHAAAPVQPVKPVPVYPVTMSHPVPQQKLPVGSVNSNAAVQQHIPTGVIPPDVQLATLSQQYHMGSAVPVVADSTAGFVPVQPNGVPDSTMILPDNVLSAHQPQQAPAADYSQASLLALYNQMMMPLPFVAPALGLNPFLVAANPMLAAQMMYGAPMMPPVSDPMGSMPAADPHLGIPSYPVAGQEHHQPMMPPSVGLDPAVRPVTGSVPSASLPSSGVPLLPVAATARPPTPRLPVSVSGHEHQSAVHAATMQKKKLDRPPHLATLEQALIEKLGGPRKPVASAHAVHAPAVHTLPGTMGWFPMAYGQHAQFAHTPTAVQSPVISPLYTTEYQQLPASIAADMATSIPSTLPSMTLTAAERTSASVASAAEPVSTVTSPGTPKLTNELAEEITTTAAEKPMMDGTASTGLASTKRKLHFTVSAVKDDPLTVNNQQETTEPSVLTSESSSLISPSLHDASVPPAAHELTAVSTNKAAVKKGRFRISDVKEAADTAVSGNQSESSSQSQETGATSDSSVNCVTAAVLTAPELSAHQVSFTLTLGVIYSPLAY